MNPEEIAAALSAHKKWLADDASGRRAFLSGANLSRAFLTGAFLTGAFLRGADLGGADLSGANLRRAALMLPPEEGWG